MPIAGGYVAPTGGQTSPYTPINPATGKPYTPEELAAAPKAGLLSNLVELGETAADVGTFGTYSAAAEALGRDSTSAFAPAISNITNATGLQPILNKTADVTGLRQLSGDLGFGTAPTGGTGGLPDISGIQGDSKTLFDAAMANYGRQLTPTEIRETAPITATPITSRDTFASGPAAAQGYGAAGPAYAETVDAPNLGPAAQVTGPENLVANQAAFTPVQKTTLERGPQDEIRALQTGALTGLQELAEGRGPAAELERARLDQALARVSDETFAAANRARGAGRGAAQLEAANALARGGVEAALAARANALENQIAARGQQIGALQGVRGQDIDFAGQAASLEQQANNLEAQIEAARQLGNAQEVNRLTSQQAALRQQAQEFNAQAQNQRTALQGQMTLEAQTGNANRSLQSGLDYAGRTDAASQFGAGAQNVSNLDYARRTDAATQANAANDLQAQIAGGAQSLTAQQNTAQNQLQTDTARSDANQGAFTATTQAQGTAGGTAAQALGAQSDALNAQVAAKKAADAEKAANREFLLEAGTGLATALSDERSKQGIKEIPGEKLDSFADAMARKVKEFEYRPGEGAPGTHFGPMAQDLEDTELGRALVHEGAGGRKMVDMDSFGNLMLAAVLRSRKAAR